MKIAVNTRLLLTNRMEGIARFIFETTKRMVLANPNIEFHFLFDRPYSDEFIFADNVIPHVVSPPSRHPILWYLW
ncbi:MAG: glycosyltransferase family 1 protein, partial [Bacteroidia bacterium]|nr:glycosyltransferase family 1 protein [Bacteroidia bacterium]